ncbi:MAG: hypothetical protein M1814_001583 [Vezdaea aestivalis]|nr:MAG: hypothetical protein M1814_001583 [Vezdaea aestivalis]
MRSIISSKRFAHHFSSSKRIPLPSILIANRGEIALRIRKAATESGIRATTIYTEADALSMHANDQPFAFNIGTELGYLDGDRIIQIAKDNDCRGIHPGYGFLSENASFAKKCVEAGLVFIGPPWEAIEAMGSKSRSKEIMTNAGVPCIPGYHGKAQNSELLAAEAERIGYPVMLKAVKGGGGKGMRICESPEHFPEKLESAKSEARNSFGDDVMLVEKYIKTPRHIEVQIFADKHGNCVALGERDCSIQRRHQKILEESPAPNIDEAVRHDLWSKAKAAALAVNYEGAGTVEFIFDTDTGEFFFMEMNTRLQVEHPVTEMITGLDLVHWQFLVAQGRELPLNQESIESNINSRGWAIEARVYAEDPERNFMPDPGQIAHLRRPIGTDIVRVDSGFGKSDIVSSHYDAMISKVIVRGESRSEALRRLIEALGQYEIAGPTTNIEFLKRICADRDFCEEKVETGYIEKHREDLFKSPSIDDETFAQVAIALILEAQYKGSASTRQIPLAASGYVTNTMDREIQLLGQHQSEPQNIRVRQTAANKFDVTVGERELLDAIAEADGEGTVQTYYKHVRIKSRVIRNGNKVDLFHRGQHFKFDLPLPAWIEKAQGAKESTNSVLAPMPCKILRVEVKKGDIVKRDQALVVIESMKMETVIRSPQDGVISRTIHRAGDLCKAGTALVEFEDNEKQG